MIEDQVMKISGKNGISINCNIMIGGTESNEFWAILLIERGDWAGMKSAGSLRSESHSAYEVIDRR